MTGSHYAALIGLELVTVSLLPPEGWDYSSMCACYIKTQNSQTLSSWPHIQAMCVSADLRVCLHVYVYFHMGVMSVHLCV